MKIGTRLYLTTLPSIVGMLLMGALAYWGQYERTAPSAVLVVGALAVALSLAITWSTARQVSRRIQRLAASPSARHVSGRDPDELDTIAGEVERLVGAASQAEVHRATSQQEHEARTREYAGLLASIVDATVVRLEDIRLPLHILLDNHFGDVNENQEEMLGAARAATEAADRDMRHLRQIALLDLGQLPLRHDRIKPAELLESVRPLLVACTEGARTPIEIDVEPLLPSIDGDRARLQEALVSLMRGALSGSGEQARIRLAATRDDTNVVLKLSGAQNPNLNAEWLAADRVVRAHGGTLHLVDGVLTINLPLAEGRFEDAPLYFH